MKFEGARVFDAKVTSGALAIICCCFLIFRSDLKNIKTGHA